MLLDRGGRIELWSSFRVHEGQGRSGLFAIHQSARSHLPPGQRLGCHLMALQCDSRQRPAAVDARSRGAGHYMPSVRWHPCEQPDSSSVRTPAAPAAAGTAAAGTPACTAAAAAHRSPAEGSPAAGSHPCSAAAARQNQAADRSSPGAAAAAHTVQPGVKLGTRAAYQSQRDSETSQTQCLRNTDPCHDVVCGRSSGQGANRGRLAHVHARSAGISKEGQQATRHVSERTDRVGVGRRPDHARVLVTRVQLRLVLRQHARANLRPQHTAALSCMANTDAEAALRGSAVMLWHLEPVRGG